HLLDEAIEVIQVVSLAVVAKLVLHRRADVAVRRDDDVAVLHDLVVRAVGVDLRHVVHLSGRQDRTPLWHSVPPQCPRASLIHGTQCHRAVDSCGGGSCRPGASSRIARVQVRDGIRDAGTRSGRAAWRDVMSTTTSPVYYDPYSTEIAADPQPTYRRLRDEVPLYYN